MGFFEVYGRALALLGRDKRIAGFLLVANLVVAGLQFLDPILFGRVIGLLSRATDTPAAEIWHDAAVLLGIWALVGAAGIAANVGAVMQAERLAHRNRLQIMNRYFGHVLNLPLSFHGDVHSGRLMKIMLSGADGLFSFWLTFFREQFTTYAAVVILLPLTLVLNWQLALALITLVVLFVGLTAVVIRRTEDGQKRAESFHGALAGTAQDALANVVVVQSFTRLHAEANLFRDIADQVIAHQFPVLNWWALVNVLTRASSTIAVITIVIVGTWLHVHGKAGVGEIVTFMGFATMLIGRLESAVSFTSGLFLRMPGLMEFFGVLDARSSVPEKPDARRLVAPKARVEFDQVSFAYPGGPRILNDVSFVAEPGRAIALVGHTGAGKSTVMNLLQRLWDPVEGRITIDGIDLRDISLESLRASIGVVFQESMLFNRSICENLRIGRPDATEAELHEACRLADAHEFIMRQPQGYDTMIGERGATLSGGQRQRLAIARALLKNPPILILDEATSALDAATEARVSRAMNNLMRGRTTFIIAHRLSTVRHADEILVFDGGRVVERGDFASLVERRGRFADLVATQLTTMPALRAAE